MRIAEQLRAQAAQLITERDAALTAADAIMAAAETEGRNALNDDEKAQFDAAIATATDAERNAEIGELQRRADEIDEIERQRKAAPKVVNFTPSASDDPYDIDLRSAPRTRDVARDIESRALRAIEREDDLDDDQKGHVERMLRNRKVNRGGALARHILATGRPEYRDAFAELTTRAQPILTAEQAEAVKEIRGLQITADGSGGYLMPFTLDPTIVLTNAGAVNPIRQLATVITVATDNWQGVASAGVTASYDAEETEVSDDTPTLTQPVVTVVQGQAFVPFSVQAEDDLAGLSQDVAEMFADAKDRLEANAFTLGAGPGSNQPYGFVTEATTVSSTTADTYAVADVYKLQQEVGARHRSRGSWMANLNILNLTRQFATGAGPQHAFLTDLAGATPPKMLGQPVYENSEMDGTIDASQVNKILAYGDFAKYRIHDRIGMTIELVPHLFGASRRPTGQRGWYCRFRHGARLIDVSAVKVLDA